MFPTLKKKKKKKNTRKCSPSISPSFACISWFSGMLYVYSILSVKEISETRFSLPKAGRTVHWCFLVLSWVEKGSGNAPLPLMNPGSLSPDVLTPNGNGWEAELDTFPECQSPPGLSIPSSGALCCPSSGICRQLSLHHGRWRQVSQHPVHLH